MIDKLKKKCPYCDNGIQRLSRLPNFPAPDMKCIWCKGTGILRYSKDSIYYKNHNKRLIKLGNKLKEMI